MSGAMIVGTGIWLLISLVCAVVVASAAQLRRAEPDVYGWLLWLLVVFAVVFLCGEAIYWGTRLALWLNGYGGTMRDAG